MMDRSVVVLLFCVLALFFFKEVSASCSDYNNCNSCTSSKCEWCTENNRCYEPNSSCSCTGPCSPSTCVKTDASQCPAYSGVCSNYLTCSDCAADLACGWNVEKNACSPGDKYGSCYSSQDSHCTGTASVGYRWQYGPNATCPKNSGFCEAYHNCQACTEDPACGWDVEKNICTPGDQYGACYNSENTACAGKASHQYGWQFGKNATCPKNYLICENYIDCQSCIDDPACGWNVENEACSPGDEYGSCYSGQSNTCPGPSQEVWLFGATGGICSKNPSGCAAYQTCYDCTADLGCGWNMENLACYPGNADGPCWSKASTTCSGTSSHNFYWQYGPNAICSNDPGGCGAHPNCAECVKDSGGGCGWNVELNKCVEGDQYGACRTSNDKHCTGTADPSFYWHFGSTATCAGGSGFCLNYVLCSECVADPMCGWNEEKGYCVPGTAEGACWSSYNPTASEWNFNGVCK